MQVTFQYVGGHIEVYDEQGRFLFSADSQVEAMRELEALQAA